MINKNSFSTKQDPILWATLASISSKKNQLEISEEAYSASLQVDKVKYLHHIKVELVLSNTIERYLFLFEFSCFYRVYQRIAMIKWQKCL